MLSTNFILAVVLVLVFESATLMETRSGLSLSWSDKSQILDTYNEFRSEIALGFVTGYSGSNMNSLYWDDGLSIVSSIHSSNCVYENNDLRNEEIQTFSNNVSWMIDTKNDASYIIGENLYVVCLFI